MSEWPLLSILIFLPLVGVAFILGGLTGWLGRRIWLNPALTTSGVR